MFAQRDHLALLADVTGEADSGRLACRSGCLNQEAFQSIGVFTNIARLKSAGREVALKFLAKGPALLLAEERQYGAQCFAPGAQKGGAVCGFWFAHGELRMTPASEGGGLSG